MSLVSIIIPVYNSERFLATSIESALSQNDVAVEVIVVNDGSTDGSLSVAQAYEHRGVQVIDSSNAGASAARNKGLAVAKGEWIQFLDADDFLRQDKLKAQLAILQSPDEIATCNTVHFHATDASDGLVTDSAYLGKHPDDPLRFLINLYGGFDNVMGMVQPNAYLTPLRVIKKAGGWNEQLSLDDDGEFFCRVVLAAKRIRYVPIPMNFYRKYRTAASLSASKNEKAYQSQYESICLKHNHLLRACTLPELERYINTATVKQLRLLMYLLYPHHKALLQEVTQFANPLKGNAAVSQDVYGGKIANFIGNRLSWKLMKRLQLLKSHVLF